MENQISCANCGEIFTPTGTSVQLPWNCDECTKAAEFQEAIAPETETVTDCCDHASVEATTELIAQLEAQVKTATDAADSLSEIVEADNKVIEDLKSQLDVAIAEQVRLDDAVNRLIKKNIDLAIENQHVRNDKQRAIEAMDRLHVEVAKFKSWTKTLIDDLVRQLKYKTEMVDYYRNDSARETKSRREAVHENILLKARGFWARVFNLEPGSNGYAG